MDADRVRSYLQVACAGLGFDIGEVWWMSNDSGTSTVAAIEDNRGNESDDQCANANANNTHSNTKPKKRFLQLYTCKAYCNQRSKLVQPHDSDDTNGDDNKESGSPEDGDCKLSSSTQLAVRQTNNSNSSNPSDEAEHVLSPRIVESVTHTTQIVWANTNSTSTTSSPSFSTTTNNNNNGLLGRSDITLQTAIGMPVGVDQSGNVWVVVMFSPNNVETSKDAIDYLQYISKSAGSTSIPCLLPVVGGNPGNSIMGSDEDGKGDAGDRKMICNNKSEQDSNNSNNRQLSLVSIKPKSNIPKSHTQELGDGVTAKFVSFNIDDDKFDNSGEGKVSQLNGTKNIENGMTNSEGRRPSEIDPSSLRNALKDDWGIPILSDTNSNSSNNAQHQQQQSQLDSIDSAITDAFDEASYGVWSTIMNSPANNGGGSSEKQQQITTTSSSAFDNESNMETTKKMNVIQERLEEFATAFLGMSVFDVADAWVISTPPNNENEESAKNNNENQILKCLAKMMEDHRRSQEAAERTAALMDELATIQVVGKSKAGVGGGGIGIGENRRGGVMATYDGKQQPISVEVDPNFLFMSESEEGVISMDDLNKAISDAVQNVYELSTKLMEEKIKVLYEQLGLSREAQELPSEGED